MFVAELTSQYDAWQRHGMAEMLKELPENMGTRLEPLLTEMGR